MKRLYARFVLWLIRPALTEHSKRGAPSAAQMAALGARIDCVVSTTIANKAAIDWETKCREVLAEAERSAIP